MSSLKTNPSLITAQLESLLLAVAKPVSYKRLAEVLAVAVPEVTAALQELEQSYSVAERGLAVVLNHNEAALVTNPKMARLVEQFVTQEEQGELTRPQLEALTVITYRGPITKLELEQIRGVNCSLILRNLQIRGLIEEITASSSLPRYQLTIDCLRYLGIATPRDLPNYETLSNHEILERIINQG